MIIKKRFLSLVFSAVAISGLLAWADADPDKVLTGKAAFSDVLTQKPGLFRKLTPADLPAPYATTSVSGFPRVVARPAGALPQALPGFAVNLYASDLKSASLEAGSEWGRLPSRNRQ